MNDSVKLVGNLKIVKKDKDGKVVETKSVPNLVVNVGKAFIASKLVNNPSSNVPSSMALGSSGTTPAGSDTTLGSELGRVKDGNFSNTISSNAITFTGVFGGGVATGSVQEAAIFESPDSGGIMLCRTTFSAITKGGSDSITVTWNVTIA